MNSWGAGWGDNGYCWIAYDLVRSGTVLEAYAVYNLSDDLTFEGSSLLCEQGQYTLNGAPAEAGYHFYTSQGARVVAIHGSQATVEVEPGYSGEVTLTARLSFGGSYPYQAEVSRTFYAGVPKITLCVDHADEYLQSIGGLAAGTRKTSCGEYVPLVIRTLSSHANNGITYSVTGEGDRVQLENSNEDVVSVWQVGWQRLRLLVNGHGHSYLWVSSRNACGTGDALADIVVTSPLPDPRPPLFPPDPRDPRLQSLRADGIQLPALEQPLEMLGM